MVAKPAAEVHGIIDYNICTVASSTRREFVVVKRMVVQLAKVLLVVEVRMGLVLMAMQPAVAWAPKVARQAPAARQQMLSCLTLAA